METFYWKTHDGRQLLPAKMETEHLINSLRLVCYRLYLNAAARDLDEIRFSYLYDAIDELSAEIEKRKLDSEQRQIFSQIPKRFLKNV